MYVDDIELGLVLKFGLEEEIWPKMHQMDPKQVEKGPKVTIAQQNRARTWNQVTERLQGVYADDFALGFGRPISLDGLENGQRSKM